ncbi:MAG: DUF6968 family protein [Dehalococcoidia bacterium]
MTAIVVAREMEWNHADGTISSVLVNIGNPLPTLDPSIRAGEWSCPFQILGLGDDQAHTVFGTDSVQALYLALKTAGSLIISSQAGRSLQLDWSELDHCGFPT